MKKTALLLSVLMILFSFVSCGSKNDNLLVKKTESYAEGKIISVTELIYDDDLNLIKEVVSYPYEPERNYMLDVSLDDTKKTVKKYMRDTLMEIRVEEYDEDGKVKQILTYDRNNVLTKREEYVHKADSICVYSYHGEEKYGFRKDEYIVDEDRNPSFCMVSDADGVFEKRMYEYSKNGDISEELIFDADDELVKRIVYEYINKSEYSYSE